MDEHIDVVPVREVGRNRLKCRFIGCAEVLHGLIGEHHSPPESVIGLIAFEHADIVRWISLLEQERRVETGGPAADDDNFQ